MRLRSRGRCGRKVTWAGVTFAGFVLAGAIAPSGAVRAATVPQGTVTLIGHAPNYFYDHRYQASQPAATTAFADPRHGLLFEYSAGASGLNCPRLVALDIDTYAVKATSARPGSNGTPCNVATSDTANFQRLSGTPAPVVAIDVADGLIFGVVNLNQIAILSEQNLDVVDMWSLPSPAVAVPSPGALPNPQPGGFRYIQGLSWDAASGNLLALATYDSPTSGQTGPPGMGVVAFSVPLGLQRHTSVPLWSTLVPGCSRALSPKFASATAYRATKEPAIYVPCVGTLGAQDNFGQEVILKMALTNTNCTAPAVDCPDGTFIQTPVPGVVDDLFFDPVSDRSFLPSLSDRTTLMIYDGHKAAFEGSTFVGVQGEGNYSILGLDASPGAGRFYALGPYSGLTLVDGRRTPLSPGSVYRDFKDTETRNVFPILPPDQAYPFTRLFVNDDTQGGADQPDFLVYADTVPVSQDPPAGQVDANTFSGAIPPGAQINTVYGATARGYGFHYDLVSGPSGAVENLVTGTYQVPLPFGSGHRDLLAGNVTDLNVRNGAAQGKASALADGTGATAYAYGQCTDLNAAQSCEPPPSCADAALSGCPDTGGLTAPPNALPTAPPTSQQWPFPNASCSQPGDTPSSSVNGTYGTSYPAPGASSSGAPQATSSPVPGSDQSQSATASVDCGGDQGHAQLRSPQIDAGGIFDVGAARTDAQVYPPPPTGTASVRSHSDALARSIHLDVAGATLDIGSVEQVAEATAAGTAGSAKATRQVTLSDVAVNGNRLCGSQNDCAAHLQTVLDEINNALPSVHVSQPQPDDRYYRAPYNAQGTGQGSDGGYIAAIEANLLEQDGDHLFNGMTPEEATYLPALRIVVYNAGDGNPNVSRTIIDLAGVQVDSELGVQVFPTYSTSDFSSAATDLAAAMAGVPASSTYVPGTPGSDSANTAANGGIGNNAGGIVGLIQRALTGLNWLVRSPVGALEMLGFLGLLSLPLIVMRRRWTWVIEHEGRKS